MGCDIHGRVQVKRWNDKWVDVGEIPDDRNYALFGALAQVRKYDVRPIDTARGLPEDVHMEGDYLMVELEEFSQDEGCAKLQYWMGDHSYSWLSLDEILQWDGWDQQGYVDITLRDACAGFIAFCAYLKIRYGKEPVRFVFGFDS